jgi:hypothetical protein
MRFVQRPSIKVGDLTRRSINRLLPLLVAITTGAYALASDQNGADQESIVVSVTGDWVCPDCPKDHKDNAVFFGEIFRHSDQRSQNCIFGRSEGSVVLKREAPRLFAFPCEKGMWDRGCDHPIGAICAVDADPQADWKLSDNPSLARRLWDAVMPELKDHPQKYMVAVSRGVEEGLVEAVVPLQNGQIDLSSAFREMDAGHYRVAISRVGAQTSSGPGATREFQFRPKSRALIDAGAIGPGLYEISLVDQADQAAGSEAWILVNGPNDYAANAAAFQDASDQSSKLPPEMDPAAERALLRAYLESLSRPKGGGRS